MDGDDPDDDGPAPPMFSARFSSKKRMEVRRRGDACD